MNETVWVFNSGALRQMQRKRYLSQENSHKEQWGTNHDKLWCSMAFNTEVDALQYMQAESELKVLKARQALTKAIKANERVKARLKSANQDGKE